MYFPQFTDKKTSVLKDTYRQALAEPGLNSKQSEAQFHAFNHYSTLFCNFCKNNKPTEMTYPIKTSKHFWGVYVRPNDRLAIFYILGVG